MGKRISLSPLTTCLYLLAIFCGFINNEAAAHPVAQGHGIISCNSSGGVTLDLSVSEEQVSVWDTFRADALANQSVLEAHRGYLQQHLSAVTPTKHVTPISVSYTGDQPSPAFHKYRIEFGPEAKLATDTCRIELFQNFLREFEFAPGNPWEAIFSLQIEREHGQTDTILLGSNSPITLDLNASQTSHSSTFWSFFVHGMHHILTGYDHLLFVTALVLGVTTLYKVFLVVSVFTLAHTITLVLSVFDIVRLSPAIVEPIITGSIIFVAASNVWSSFRPERKRIVHGLIPAFFFGLFHGLGFAGGLLENLTQGDTLTIGTALTGFAAGVEVGHQIVIIPLVGILCFCSFMEKRMGVYSLDRYARRYISLVVVGLGVFYFGYSLGLLS